MSCSEKLKLSGAKLTDRVSDMMNVGAEAKAAAAYSWLQSRTDVV